MTELDEYDEYVDEGTGEILHEFPPNPITGELRRRIEFYPPDAYKDLAGRLSNAVKAVEGRIPERGENKRQGFKFATSEDIKEATRLAFAENGLTPLMGMVEPPKISAPTSGYSGWDFYTVEYEVVLMAPEGYIRIPYFACALDNGDKGPAKTLTTGWKYFVTTVLQIPRGDEPDADATEKPGGEKPKSQGSGRRTTRKPAQPKPAKPALEDDGTAKPAEVDLGGPDWPGETMYALRQLKLTEDFDDVKIKRFLNKHATLIGPNDAADIVANWVRYVHEARQGDVKVAEAVEIADHLIAADKFIVENAGVIPDKEKKVKAEAD